MQPVEFKCILVGDPGVGKTTYISRHVVGEFERKTDKEKQVDITPLTWYTNLGSLAVKVWDSEKPEGLSNDDIQGAQCAMIMFDLTSEASYKNIEKWYKQITDVCDYIPIVILGNKADSTGRVLRPKNITYHRRKNLMYYDISAKANFNFEKPFLYLMGRLCSDPNLILVEAPALRPAESIMAYKEIQLLEEEWEEALMTPLTDFE